MVISPDLGTTEFSSMASLLFSTHFTLLVMLGLCASKSFGRPYDHDHGEDDGDHDYESYSPRRKSADSHHCPAQAYDLTLRFYPKTGECYRGGTRGPCGENMILYGQPDNRIYGTCDCDHAGHNRTLIFHQESNKCYFVFTQGYCPDNQWLTISRRTGRPECEPNPCQMQTHHGEEYVRYNGECVILGSPCGKDGQVITFDEPNILPRCVKPLPGPFAPYAFGAPTIKCAPGSVISYSGKCQKSWKF